MKLRMGSYQELVMPMRMCSPIVGLSPLELELLLDQSLEEAIDFHEENPDWEDENPPEMRGNYFQHGNFLDDCKSVRGKIPKERYLETPQIFVEKKEEKYSINYNSQIDERIAKKLAQFKRTKGDKTPSIDKLFSKRFANERKWIVEQQLMIVKYLCETQNKYLQSENPFDLEPIHQQDVANHIDYSASTVSRLVKNLSIQLPKDRIIFADELIPGLKVTTQKGTYALRQLQEDLTLYKDGKWKVSDRKLMPILKERFGLEVARRTITKYKGMLD